MSVLSLGFWFLFAFLRSSRLFTLHLFFGGLLFLFGCLFSGFGSRLVTFGCLFSGFGSRLVTFGCLFSGFGSRLVTFGRLFSGFGSRFVTFGRLFFSRFRFIRLLALLSRSCRTVHFFASSYFGNSGLRRVTLVDRETLAVVVNGSLFM